MFCVLERLTVLLGLAFVAWVALHTVVSPDTASAAWADADAFFAGLAADVGTDGLVADLWGGVIDAFDRAHVALQDLITGLLTSST